MSLLSQLTDPPTSLEFQDSDLCFLKMTVADMQKHLREDDTARVVIDDSMSGSMFEDQKITIGKIDKFL